MVVPTLCLLCAIATAVQPAPVAPLGGPEPAQYEELTLLFHGALQLGQALNGVYKATEARLTEAGRSLGLFDQALEFLGREVNQGRDATRELRTSLLEIQVSTRAGVLLGGQESEEKLSPEQRKVTCWVSKADLVTSLKPHHLLSRRKRTLYTFRQKPQPDR